VENVTSGYDVAVVGASAGGVRALRTLFAGFPADYRGIVAAVLHRSPVFESQLPDVLGAQSPLPVLEPDDGTAPEPGHIYVAPRDQHLSFGRLGLRLDRGPKQHFTRPAIDPLFLSAAQTYGRRVVGVVLTGGGDDGVDGLIAIKACGGMTIVQEPEEAAYPTMPRNALLYDHVDFALPLEAIAPKLAELFAARAAADLNLSTPSIPSNPR
jgi:two-component system chemotaxis response regulator CheB